MKDLHEAFATAGLKTKYNTGTTNRVNRVELNSPHTITVAKGRCTSDPKPVVKDAGSNPKIATKEASKIGRKQSRPPWMIDSTGQLQGFGERLWILPSAPHS